MDVTTDEETWLTTGTVWSVNMDTHTLTKTAVTLGEYDPTYGTYVILEGITAESYLADPAEAGVKEGAAVHMLGELEYMGQTEPVPTTLPADSGETGEAADPDMTPVVDITPPEEPQEDVPMNGGSLVMPTEDPDKQ